MVGLLQGIQIWHIPYWIPHAAGYVAAELATANRCQLLVRPFAFFCWKYPHDPLRQLLLRRNDLPIRRHPRLVRHANHPRRSQLWVHLPRVICDGTVWSSSAAHHRRCMAEHVVVCVCCCRDREASAGSSGNRDAHDCFCVLVHPWICEYLGP